MVRAIIHMGSMSSCTIWGWPAAMCATLSTEQQREEGTQLNLSHVRTWWPCCRGAWIRRMALKIDGDNKQFYLFNHGSGKKNFRLLNNVCCWLPAMCIAMLLVGKLDGARTERTGAFDVLLLAAPPQPRYRHVPLYFFHQLCPPAPSTSCSSPSSALWRSSMSLVHA